MSALGLGLGLQRAALVGEEFGIPPTNLIATPSLVSNVYQIAISWTAPVGDTPVDYTVQRQEVLDGVWGNDVTIVHPTVTHTYTSLPDGRYRVRVRANYGANPSSNWVTSGIITAFITERFTFDNRYHAVRT